MRKRSYFIPVTSWILILASGLLLPMSILPNIALYHLYQDDAFDDALIPAYNRIEVLFYSNLPFFTVLMSLLTLLTLVGAIALLRRRNWARFVLSGVMGTGMLGTLTLLAAYFRYDYAITAWREPWKNELFERYLPWILGLLVLLLTWLVYKINSPKITQKLS